MDERGVRTRYRQHQSPLQFFTIYPDFRRKHFILMLPFNLYQVYGHKNKLIYGVKLYKHVSRFCTLQSCRFTCVLYSVSANYIFAFSRLSIMSTDKFFSACIDRCIKYILCIYAYIQRVEKKKKFILLSIVVLLFLCQYIIRQTRCTETLLSFYTRNFGTIKSILMCKLTCGRQKRSEKKLILCHGQPQQNQIDCGIVV